MTKKDKTKRRKLPNGMGSIEKVEFTPQGKKRVSQYRARLPKSMGRKDIGFFKSYNKAMDALKNYKKPEPEITFKQIYIKFTKSNTFLKVSPKTQQRHQRSFERFEELHDMNIHDIKYSDLQDVLDQMELEGYDKPLGNGEYIHMDYSQNSIKRLKIVVSKIYERAIKDNLIQLDLSKYLEVGGVGIRRKKETFSKEEIEKLFKSIPHNPNAMHILFMIFTGMRTGEYLYLKTKNIDLAKNQITDFGEKTEAGKTRKMYIHPKIKDLVTYLISQSQTGNVVEVKKTNGQAYVPSDTKFYKDIYYPALEKAGIERKIPYTCRYTFATIAHQSGVSDKALQKLMGHTDFSVTANSYIQEYDDYLYKELQKI
ncbi:site-specific integrase [uncultured Anaerococcus sp.]|uniref:tyrosine-type recombinase/integrase n=1 Tax=uncultured Anaerococcus sp. TaxID=293428 RepID=UPI00288BB6D4|nr:site-specific integrase [uncultured Anaerococcus sp.]